MNFAVSIAQGFLFAGIFAAVKRRQPRYGLPLMMLFTVILILTVYALYHGQDDRVWPFFFHPYLSLMITDLVDYYVNRESRFEKLFIWPFFLLPAVCGFILCCGWVLNIHALRELMEILQ